MYSSGHSDDPTWNDSMNTGEGEDVSMDIGDDENGTSAVGSSQSASQRNLNHGGLEPEHLRTLAAMHAAEGSYPHAARLLGLQPQTTSEMKRMIDERLEAAGKVAGISGSAGQIWETFRQRMLLPSFDADYLEVPRL